jgi:hypothetical protein
MTRITPGFSTLCRIVVGAVPAIVLVCAPVATAQHGGGHFGGGGAHASAPHVAAPPVSHAMPMRVPSVTSPPIVGGGPRGFVAAPPQVRLIQPPAAGRPVIGNHVIMPLPPLHAPPTPRTVIGFSSGDGSHTVLMRDPRSLSFSGEGREIWQDPAGSGSQTRARGANSGEIEHSFVTRPQATHTEPFHFPRRPPIGPIRPVHPVFPIFGFPVFGLGFGFGGPFGLGWGFNSFWGASCGPYWGWGYGCNSLPLYDYGFGNGYAPSNNVEGQPENSESGPLMYENPPSVFMYGDEQRDLAQLYLKDGTVYNVTDYWLVNSELHFTMFTPGTEQSTEEVIDFDQLDLQKTIDVNTQRGFRFVLRNEPLDQYLQGTEQNQNPPVNAPPPNLNAPAQPPMPPQPSSPAQPAQPR